MSDFVEHPMIKPGVLQSRLYQQSILGRVIKENLLVVLPTGLGKTPIAIMLAAHMLRTHPGYKIMVLAPTKPLTNQHSASFRRFLNVDPGQFQVVTGEVPPSERQVLYEHKRIIFATPQTIRNDIAKDRLGLGRFSLLVVDEAHHSIGGYAYPFIAKRYREEAEHPRILALTASPGATREKISEICDNLGVKAVDIRTEHDMDVQPYVMHKEIEQVRVSLPPSFVGIRDMINTVYQKKLAHLRKFGFTKPSRLVTKKDLLYLQGDFMGQLKGGKRSAFAAISIITQCIKLEHAIGLLETQGIRPLLEYWDKLKSDKTKASKVISNDKQVVKAIGLTKQLAERGSRHPKISKLCTIVDEEMRRDLDSRIIIFANYRTSVEEIVGAVSNVSGAKPVRFVGQKMGVTQKQQMETVNRFRAGDFNILVATSVGEEGLDIPSANLAIFYEPVPSPLRSIQRRGRVGRASIGRVVLLITEDTRDEGYFWTSHHREKRMKSILKGMKGEGGESRIRKPKTLYDFS
ncbi:MAG: DEAD/DEAH box helicase family protein [Candidatus Aenigmarchaeota archaeon]|nr:DEAD/DEAH box helicase family protein [Candidatus Aenigmarchaeota archaeon]